MNKNQNNSSIINWYVFYNKIIAQIFFNNVISES